MRTRRSAGIDAAAARAMPGVLAVLTGADYRAAGLAGIRQLPVPADVIDHRRKAFGPDSARPPFDTPQWPLAIERVRHVGEPLAVVIAETLDAARDAAAAVEVDYDILPAVTDVLRRDCGPARRRCTTPCPDNLALDTEFGAARRDRGGVRRADIVVEQTFRNQRIVNAQMEPRAALGSYDPAEDRYTLISGNQGVHRQKVALAECLGVAPERVRVICPMSAARSGCAPTSIPSRSSSSGRRARSGGRCDGPATAPSASSPTCRAAISSPRRGSRSTAPGASCALSVDLLGNVGAHPVSYVTLNNGYRIMTTVYDIPVAHVRIRAAFTNTMPTATYRGAGRPEAHFCLERLIDIAAARLGIDRLEIRRRNLDPPRAASVSHRHGPQLRQRRFLRQHGARRGARRLERRRGAQGGSARKRGKRVGIGIASYVEAPVGAPHERVRVAGARRRRRGACRDAVDRAGA